MSGVLDKLHTSTPIRPSTRECARRSLLAFTDRWRSTDRTSAFRPRDWRPHSHHLRNDDDNDDDDDDDNDDKFI